MVCTTYSTRLIIHVYAAFTSAFQTARGRLLQQARVSIRRGLRYVFEEVHDCYSQEDKQGIQTREEFCNDSVCICAYIYACVYVYVCVCVYIYIYISLRAWLDV
jgi:hypothetical protein